MDVGEVASKPVVACQPTATMAQAGRLMREHDIGCVVVVDEEQHPVGIVTDRDLVVRGVANERPPDATVAEVMSHEPVTISSDRDTTEAATHMATRQCRRLPVVDDRGHVVGVIAMDDLLMRADHTLDEISRLVSSEVRSRRPG